MTRTHIPKSHLPRGPAELFNKLVDLDNVADKLEQPLIADDSGTRVHAVFRNGTLYDSTGTQWTTVGQPTPVAAANGLPEGASRFTYQNYWRTTLAPDPADLASFAACIVVAPTTTDLAVTSMLLSNGFQAPSSGYELVANEDQGGGPKIRWIANGECADNPLIADQPNVICFGQDSSIARSYLKVNMRPIVITAGVLTPLSTFALKLGVHFDDAASLGFQGTIYECWFSNSLPGGLSAAFYGPELWDEYFAEITRRAFARMGMPVLSASQIVFLPNGSTTCNVHLASTNQRLELIATSNSVFTIAAPTAPITGTTIRAGQRFTLKIKNSSGGALGAVTWNATYKMAAWTSPANGFSRSITFEFDGTAWIEVSRTTADVPN